MVGAKPTTSDTGFTVALFLLVVIGVFTNSFWWFAGIAAVLGGLVAFRALLNRFDERRALAAKRRIEWARRAEQQHRWTIGGDNRGVYGPAGADAMRLVSPSWPPLDGTEPPQNGPETAAIAYTTRELASLIEDKPPCWRWAVFASVLVQRREPLQTRLHDSALGFMTGTGETLTTGPEVAMFVVDLLNDLDMVVEQVDNFMRTPAFGEMFGDPGDESTADADGILHIAKRLMDYHDRFLALSERCRAASVPSRYRDLIRDCAQLADAPLQGYRRFIDDFVARVEEMPALLRFATGTVAVDPVVLHVDVDDALMKRISKQVKKLPAQ